MKRDRNSSIAFSLWTLGSTCGEACRRIIPALLPVLLILWALTPASAQNTLEEVVEKIGIDQHLGEQVPLDLVFRDETGREVTLGDYFSDKPVILALVYYECPMLCNLILNGLSSALKTLAFTAGDEFDIVTVSFDSTETPETAAAKKSTYLRQYSRPGAEKGWHFLTGEEEFVEALAQAVGFRYTWDESSGQFAHGSAIMIATPEGRLARYMFGIEYPARDLRLALVEASENNIGSPVDQLLLLCFQYDPSTGKYGFVIMNALRLLGAATILALGGFILLAVRRERKERTS